MGGADGLALLDQRFQLRILERRWGAFEAKATEVIPMQHVGQGPQVRILLELVQCC